MQEAVNGQNQKIKVNTYGQQNLFISTPASQAVQACAENTKADDGIMSITEARDVLMAMTEATEQNTVKKEVEGVRGDKLVQFAEQNTKVANR